MRLGLYGGSFDPIHSGHISPLRAAADQLQLDRILYLPTAQPPHKRGQEKAPIWHRFAMVEMALLDDPRCHVSTFEMDDREAFTIDSVTHFQAEFPDDQLFLIIGADSFLKLETWFRGAELVAAIELVVLIRPGFRLDPATFPGPQKRVWEAGRVHGVEHEPIEASSTEIRRLLAAGETPPPGWLHHRVLSYALKYGLYTAP